MHRGRKSTFFVRFGARKDGDSIKHTFKGQPKEVDKVQKFFHSALKNEMQVIVSNSDDQVCNSVPVPCTVSTSANSSEKCAPDVDLMECSDDK